MKKGLATRFLSIMLGFILICGMLVSVEAKGEIQKAYTISEGESFEYTVMVDETGYYVVELNGHDKKYNERVEFIHPLDGEPIMYNWFAERDYDLLYFTEGISYTYKHLGMDFTENNSYYVLKIYKYPAVALTLEKPAKYSFYATEDSITHGCEYIAFTPPESGWYTFYNDNNTDSMALVLQRVNEAFEGAMFTDKGLHYYCCGGMTTYLELQGYAEENKGRIRVEKSSFPIVTEEKNTTIELAGVAMDGGLAFQYAKFVPGKSGEYKISYVMDSISADCGYGVCDSVGTAIPSEQFSWETKCGEYNLEKGKSYYIGVSASNGTCEISVEFMGGVGQEFTAPEKKEGEVHTYKSASGDVCTVCGYIFQPEISEYSKKVYAAKQNVPVRSSYYAKSGEIVRTVEFNKEIKVTHRLVNALGNTWFKTDDGNYIFIDNLTTQPYKEYDIKYNANGGKDAPAPSLGICAKRYKISTNVPARDGYVFLGWATNKDATSATYKPGQALDISGDVTLYAVWGKDEYDIYRRKIEVLKKNIVDKLGSEKAINQLQIKQVELKSDGNYHLYKRNNDSGGRCNVSSATTLLNRKLFLDKKMDEKMFTPTDVFCGNGCKNVVGQVNGYVGQRFGQPGYAYSGRTGNWWTKSYTNEDGTKYKFVKLSKKDVIEKKGSRTYEEYIASLLISHPEGICLRNTKATHVLVITDFEKMGDKIQFYVQDPVNQYTGILESAGCWLYGQAVEVGKDKTIYDSLDAIVYIE